MMRLPVTLLAVTCFLGATAAQGPNLGPLTGPLDPILGQVVPPALAALYNATGQNITREDVRITLDMNFTKGDLRVGGLLIGAGTAEIQAHIQGRLEMRVISSERVRAAIEGDNAYNMSAENATFLSEVFLPAEAFRATATAEVIAAFQKDQEASLHDYLANAMPEMDILKLEFAWSNIHPQQAATDLSLTEPPIVLELDLILQYVRIESIPSLIDAYFDRDQEKADAKKARVDQIKEDNSDPVRSRDFFAAAAYTQLLNLSMQPGWTLDVAMHLPRGYSFTYFNEKVERQSDRDASFRVDGSDSDTELKEVYLASITHRQFVAAALFACMWAVGIVAALPVRFVYGRKRVLDMPLWRRRP